MKTNLMDILTADPETETDVAVEEKEETKELNHIIIFNDDVNTFDHVIQSLIDVCGHTSEQAAQCAQIIHNNGKCSVKQGSFKKLRPMCEALIDRDLSATIE